MTQGVFLQNIDLYYHSIFTALIDYSVNKLKQKLMTLKYLSPTHITVIACVPCLQNSIIHICHFLFASADYKRFSVLVRLLPLTEYTDAVLLVLVNIVGLSEKCWFWSLCRLPSSLSLLFLWSLAIPFIIIFANAFLRLLQFPKLSP